MGIPPTRAAQPAPAFAQRLRDLLAGPDEAIGLAEAALLVAGHGYPGLDVDAYLARIDQLAAMLRSRIGADGDVRGRIAALNNFLFGELGFGPNDEDYYDPRNSFLNEVLERRKGIPITLSVIYMELGRRIGLPLQGVSFPGHFLVRCAVDGGTVVLDPYSGGISLGLKDLQKRLREVRGGEVSGAIVSGLLAAASNRDIIARVLRNLKAIYLKAGDFGKALPIVDCIVDVVPDQAPERRDRGMIYQELECSRAALADFEAYLAAAPGAEDAADIRGRVAELRVEAARIN